MSWWTFSFRSPYTVVSKCQPAHRIESTRVNLATPYLQGAFRDPYFKSRNRVVSVSRTCWNEIITAQTTLQLHRARVAVDPDQAVQQRSLDPCWTTHNCRPFVELAPSTTVDFFPPSRKKRNSDANTMDEIARKLAHEIVMKLDS